MTTQKITITTPDDWHVHLRDGTLLAETAPATARCFQRAIVMPNLVPPVTDAQLASAYRERIVTAWQNNNGPDNNQPPFEPLMTVYLTNTTSPAVIREAAAAGVTAAKLYPAGATTNSAAAVSGVAALYPVFETMAEVGMPLLIHGEVTDQDIDIFDREAVFIERHLQPITERLPTLKVVFEHITTADAVHFVAGASSNVAATITPQHLMLNRNDLLVGGIRPHNYCLPVLKRSTHQQALRDAVASGSEKFFLGTDSAPHSRDAKENACGCAGCYSAWSALEMYTTVFEELGALDKLEAFASFHGADFYGLPRNTGSVTLQKKSWQIPEFLTLPDGDTIVPFQAGQSLNWQLVARHQD